MATRSFPRLLASKWLLPHNAILSTDMLPKASAADMWEGVKKWNHAALDEAIEFGNEEAIREQIANLFRIIRETPCDAQMKRAMFIEQLIHIMRRLADKGGDTTHVLDDSLNVTRLLNTHNVDELESWYCDVCLRVADYFAAMRSQRPERVSERVISMFTKDPSRNYSLDELAGMFYMSPTYLGHIFKKEKGQTLHAYLTAERIRLAKLALARTDAPVYEIAERYGYQNLRSFYTAFKKSEDCTPSEYRERMKNK